MSRSKFQTVEGVSIYPIEYLINSELTDNDLNRLLDNNKIGLKYSLIFGMFRYTKSNLKNNQIIKMIKNDINWFDKIKWSSEQQKEYENLVIDVYKNVYQYKDAGAVSLAQWFMTLYGLSIS